MFASHNPLTEHTNQLPNHSYCHYLTLIEAIWSQNNQFQMTSKYQHKNTKVNFMKCNLVKNVTSIPIFRDCRSAFCDGNSAMKRRVWAQPAYFPYFSTNASATRLQSLGVRRAPASSGSRYLVAILFIPCIKRTFIFNKVCKYMSALWAFSPSF